MTLHPDRTCPCGINAVDCDYHKSLSTSSSVPHPDRDSSHSDYSDEAIEAFNEGMRENHRRESTKKLLFSIAAMSDIKRGHPRCSWARYVRLMCEVLEERGVDTSMISVNIDRAKLLFSRKRTPKFVLGALVLVHGEALGAINAIYADLADVKPDWYAQSKTPKSGIWYSVILPQGAVLVGEDDLVEQALLPPSNVK